MKITVFRAPLAFLFPGGLLLLALYLFMKPLGQASWMPTLLPALAGLTWGLLILLSWRYNMPRIMLLALLTAGCWALLHPLAPPGATLTLIRWCTLLLPINAMIILLLPARGGFRFVFGFLLILNLCQLGLLFLFARHDPVSLEGLLLSLNLDHPFTQFAGVLLWLFPFLYLSGRYAVTRLSLDAHLFWAGISLWLGMLNQANGQSQLLYWTAGIVILVWSILEEGYALAYRDGLTDLLTRRAFNEGIKRLGSRFVVAMVDIDHFKKINDRHGHDTGDQILRMVAGRLQEVGGSARVFRYGGEEFVLLFTGKTIDEVIPLLEEMRKEVQDHPFLQRERRSSRSNRVSRSEKRRVSVTISIGVAEMDGEFDQPNQVVKAADKALYKAKKDGRNRLCRYPLSANPRQKVSKNRKKRSTKPA